MFVECLSHVKMRDQSTDGPHSEDGHESDAAWCHAVLPLPLPQPKSQHCWKRTKITSKTIEKVKTTSNMSDKEARSKAAQIWQTCAMVTPCHTMSHLPVCKRTWTRLTGAPSGSVKCPTARIWSQVTLRSRVVLNAISCDCSVNGKKGEAVPPSWLVSIHALLHLQNLQV